MPSTRVNVLRPDSRHHRLDGSLASDLLTCGTSMLTAKSRLMTTLYLPPSRPAPVAHHAAHTTQTHHFDITHWLALDKSFQSTHLHLLMRTTVLRHENDEIQASSRAL
jgi:hypothetical protein